MRENSPAAKAGLKAGDIIVEADGKSVKNNMDLIRAINDKKDGDVTLTIVRDRNRQTLRVSPQVSKNNMIPNGENDGGRSTRLQTLQLLDSPSEPSLLPTPRIP